MSGRAERAERLRSIPLEEVAESLGYQRDPRDGARWRRDGSIVSISGAKFYDHLQGKGGGGAIDLVIHAEGCGFLQALDRLEPSGGAGQADPGRGRWARVRGHLAGERRLDPALLDWCRKHGLLAADRRANAAFICRNGQGEPVGAELLGTSAVRPFRGMAKGSRKALGGFWIARRQRPETALLVESAVDALSAWSLDGLPDFGIVISTAGVAAAMPAWTGGLGLEAVLCGYDADWAGDRAAAELERRDRRVRRLRPDGGKDWNDILAERGGGGAMIPDATGISG